jgi:hypothetical protein
VSRKGKAKKARIKARSKYLSLCKKQTENRRKLISGLDKGAAELTAREFAKLGLFQ